MTMDSQATLVAPLGDILDDFLHCEVVCVLHQVAELEAAMKLHQARMKDVCYSIKAHYLWENFEFPLHDFSQLCWCCGEDISPEFDLGRHRGFCYLMDEARHSVSAHESFYPHLYPLKASWV